MNPTRLLKWMLVLLACGRLNTADAQALASKVLRSFEIGETIISSNNATIKYISDVGVTDGRQAIQVTYKAYDNTLATAYPTCYMIDPTNYSGLPLNLSAYNAFAVDITNSGQSKVDLALLVQDANGNRGQISIDVPTGQTLSWLFLTDAAEFAKYPMSGYPPIAGFKVVPLPAIQNLSTHIANPPSMRSIEHLEFFTSYLPTDKTIIFDNLRAVKVGDAKSLFTGMVDGLGQYTRAVWPGKLMASTTAKQVQELQTRKDAETAWLSANPPPTDRDAFGGYQPTLKPFTVGSGRFTTVKIKNQWWLVTPAGNKFFSLGVCCVGHHFYEPMERWMDTPLNQHQRLSHDFFFTDLPDASNPHYADICVSARDTIKCFNFYEANCEKKYGATYKHDIVQRTYARLQAWGFNTIGNWSSFTPQWSSPLPPKSRKAVNAYVIPPNKIPFVANISLADKNGVKTINGLPDPFENNFPDIAEQAIGDFAPRIKNDAYFIGYYVDNELPWSDSPGQGESFDLPLRVLNVGIDRAAKMKFKQLLYQWIQGIDHHDPADIASLNKRWGTRYTDWHNWETADHKDGVTSVLNSNNPQLATLKSDLHAFEKIYASQYFQTVNAAIKNQDPNHLYLGCRFSNFTPDIVTAASETNACDVISFNIYVNTLDEWGFLKAFNKMIGNGQLTKPCIVGEFQFGATDRGRFSGGFDVGTQAQRASHYQAYVNRILAHPQFVGCHWFLWIDEELTARPYDMENGNIGFISVTDDPYPELRDAARQTNRAAYTTRLNQGER
jgi:hypothetical protein